MGLGFRVKIAPNIQVLGRFGGPGTGDQTRGKDMPGKQLSRGGHFFWEGPKLLTRTAEQLWPSESRGMHSKCSLVKNVNFWEAAKNSTSCREQQLFVSYAGEHTDLLRTKNSLYRIWTTIAAT